MARYYCQTHGRNLPKIMFRLLCWLPHASSHVDTLRAAAMADFCTIQVKSPTVIQSQSWCDEFRELGIVDKG